MRVRPTFLTGFVIVAWGRRQNVPLILKDGWFSETFFWNVWISAVVFYTKPLYSYGFWCVFSSENWIPIIVFETILSVKYVDDLYWKILPAPFSEEAAGFELGESERPLQCLRHDDLVAGEGHRRLPHGCHQCAVERPALSGRRKAPGQQCVSGLDVAKNGPRIHEFLQQINREV